VVTLAVAVQVAQAVAVVNVVVQPVAAVVTVAAAVEGDKDHYYLTIDGG
jgi:hypothetical protein